VQTNIVVSVSDQSKWDSTRGISPKALKVLNYGGCCILYAHNSDYLTEFRLLQHKIGHLKTFFPANHLRCYWRN